MLNRIANLITQYYRRPHVKNSGVLIFENLLKLLLGFIFNILLARTLSYNDFSVYSIAVVYLAIAITISGFGFDTIIMRYFGQGKYSENTILSTVIFGKICLAIITFCLVLVYFLFAESSHDIIVMLVIIVPLLFVPFETITMSNQFKFQNSIVVKTRVKIFLLFFAIKVFYLFFFSNLIGLAALISLESISTSIFLLRNSEMQLKLKSCNTGLLKTMMFDSFLFFLTSALSIFHAKMELIICRNWFPVEVFSNYSVSLRMIEIVSVFSSSYIANLFALHSNDLQDDMSSRTTFSFRSVYLISILLSVFTFLLSYIIPFLYGVKFNNVQNYLQMMSWRPFLTGVLTYRGVILVLKNRGYLSIVTSLLGVVLFFFFVNVLPNNINYFLLSVFLSFSFSFILIDALFQRDIFKSYFNISSV